MEKLSQLTLTAAVVCFLAAVACSSTDEAARAGLSDGCIINTDCNSPLVCAFRRCHNACSDSRDCPAGTRCVASDKPFHVCQLTQERDCSYNSQCPVGQLCGVDGQCRDECSADRDCVPMQLCSGGTCADPSELTNNGLLPSKQDAGATGTPCAYNSQCPDPQVCRTTGTCGVECLGDRDCARGQSCVTSRCTAGTNDGGTIDGAPDSTVDGTVPDSSMIPDGAPPGYGNPCALPSDCTLPLVCTFGRCSYQCNTPLDCAPLYCCSTQHTCVTGSVCSVGTDGGIADAGGDAKACTDDSECQDSVKCNGAERCVGGRCAAALESLCDDRNPCTTDACTESSGTCTHTAIGPQDNDHDGHFAAACGGTADDCDDNNVDVYPGHPELCDGVDNNCNGVADEGVWSVAAPIALRPTGFGSDVGAPGIVHYNDGTFGVVAGETRGVGIFDGFHLGSTLAVTTAAQLATVGGSVACGSIAARSTNYASAATDGMALGATFLGVNATACGCCGGALDCGNWFSTSTVLTARADLSGMDTVSTLATFGPPPMCGYFTYRASIPAVAWNAATSQFALAWSDTHLGSESTAHVYVATMTTSGGVSSGHSVLQSLASETIDPLTYAPTPIAVGPSTVLVAWQAMTGRTVRYVLMDSSLATVVHGPFDLSQPEDWIATSAAFTGTSFALATQTANGSATRVHRIDATTGAELASTTITGPSGGGDARLAAVHGGWALTTSHVNRVAFGWAPESLAGGFSLTETAQGASTSSAGITMIDAKHAAIVWQDGSLKAAIVTCGP